jgi:hypothetical protein
VKKNIPATAARPEAPPHPISTILNVNVEITNLRDRSVTFVAVGGRD